MKKNHIVIIRFGKPTLVSSEIKAMFEKGLVTSPECGCSGNLGMEGHIMLLNTDLSAQEVVDVFKEAEEEAGDNLPMFAFNLVDCGLNLKDDTFKNVHELIAVYKERFGLNDLELGKEVCTMGLDELLEKISREGIDSLTEEEHAHLKSLKKSE